MVTEMKHTSASEKVLPVIDHDRYVPFIIISISNNLYRGASQFYQARFGIGVTEWRVLSALAAEPNDIGAPPEWNFTKYLLNRDGVPVARWPSNMDPAAPSVTNVIEALLAKPA